MIFGEGAVMAGDDTAVASGALAMAAISDGKYCSQNDEK